MSSIFYSIDQQVNGTKEFWQKANETSLEDISANKLLSSHLTYLTPSGVHKSRHIILTTTRLYSSKTEKLLGKMTTITWKLLEPFHESNGSEERFGFRISQKNSFRDFYTKSGQELEVFLEAFNSLLILSDLESDYELQQELGSGTYGKVFLSKNLLNSKTYAVKSIKKSTLANPMALSALVSEITVMRKLNHPSILKLHSLYEGKKSVHLVLDYVPGGDLLHRLMIKSVFPEETAAKLMKNLLESLNYMHKNNIVHRDLKPDNILMQNQDCDCCVVIADLGLACECKEDLFFRCGSPEYVAPEILMRVAYGSKVDVFSAGVILYILLSGRTPFYGKTHAEVLMQNKVGKVGFQEKYWRGVSKEALDLVMMMTNRDPEFRPTAEDALKHPWFTLKKYNKREKVEEEKKEERISEELMRRINKRKEDMNDRRRDEVKGETKNAKEVLLRLREADHRS